MKELIEFIKSNWDGTLRVNKEDCDTLIGLPKPYTVPSINDFFNELYYWDTYFTNVGLILSDKLEYAIDNVENIAYLIDKYGYMPNGNRTYYLTRSQPPFFSLMVREVYERMGDKLWLGKMYGSASREYNFWQNKRMTSSGLNRYYHNFDNSDKEMIRNSAEHYCRRQNLPIPEDEATLFNYAENMRVVCESGWDCTSRFGARTFDYNWLDLNCLLYGMEDNMAYFAKELDDSEADLWIERRDARGALMNELCWSDNLGIFVDYDYVNSRQSGFISAASLYPLFVGLATPEQAKKTLNVFDKLEQKHGLASCADGEGVLNLQWDYPYGWAPHHYIAIAGLERYGYRDIARVISDKYARLVERNFIKTGNVWEKYNVVTGEVAMTKENNRKITMMGWSAGVYLYTVKDSFVKKD